MVAPDLPGGNVYFPAEIGDEATLRKRALADAVRRVAEDAMMVDGSAADVADLEAALAAVEAVSRVIAAMPSLRERRRSEWSAHEQSLAERGPFVGRSNPLAPPLHVAQDGHVTRAWAVFGQAYEGGPGDLHGGTVAGAFDDVLGCAQFAGPRVGRTGTLTVRYRSPSPVAQRIDYEARIDRVEGRKVFCSGEAWAGGVLLAEAEAIFVVPRSRVPVRPEETETPL